MVLYQASPAGIGALCLKRSQPATIVPLRCYCKRSGSYFKRCFYELHERVETNYFYGCIGWRTYCNNPGSESLHRFPSTLKQKNKTWSKMSIINTMREKKVPPPTTGLKSKWQMAEEYNTKARQSHTLVAKWLLCMSQCLHFESG